MSWTLVTGGAKGVGAAICLALAKQGHNLVIHTRESSPTDIQKQCQNYGVKVATIQADFSHELDFFIKTYLENYPKTHAVVHNVGNYDTTPLLEMPLDCWQDLYQTNLTAPFAITQALAPSLKETKGAVVHLGVAGLDLWRTDPHSSAYRMTKMGLFMLTRSLAKEFAPFKVRVNMVSPGQLETSVNAPKEHTLPMNRLGKKEEVADVVAFLLSDKGSYITGQNVEVSGGYKL